MGFAWVLKPEASAEAKAENLCVRFGEDFSFCPFKVSSVSQTPVRLHQVDSRLETLRVSVWGAVRGTMRKLRHKGSMLKGAHTQLCVS